MVEIGDHNAKRTSPHVAERMDAACCKQLAPNLFEPAALIPTLAGEQGKVASHAGQPGRRNRAQQT
jgi:hypothetical protein